MSKHDAIQSELLKLKKGGIIQPKDVVKAARNPESAMHALFTWDDGKAGELYRLEEARRLLRTYVVIEEAPTKEHVRAFVSLSSDRNSGGGYRHIADVLSDEELYQRMLQDSLDELRAFQHKYRTVKEMQPVFEAADQVQMELQPSEGTLAA